MIQIAQVRFPPPFPRVLNSKHFTDPPRSYRLQGTVAIPVQDHIFCDVRVRDPLISSPSEAREMFQLGAKHGIPLSECVQ